MLVDWNLVFCPLQVTLVYHAKLDDAWTEAARKLKAKLSGLRSSSSQVTVIGRSKNQKVLLDQDFLLERMPVNGKDYFYKQVHLPKLCSICDSGLLSTA